MGHCIRHSSWHSIRTFGRVTRILVKDEGYYIDWGLGFGVWGNPHIFPLGMPHFSRCEKETANVGRGL